MSREFDLNKIELTNLLYCLFPSQIYKIFTIIDPQSKVVSQVLSILEGKTAQEEWKDRLHKSQKPMSKNGRNFATKQVLKIDY